MTNDDKDIRWNPRGWALGADGETYEQGRWEYWLDDELLFWWSESDRQAYHRQRQDGTP